jgi:hypothetical protein
MSNRTKTNKTMIASKKLLWVILGHVIAFLILMTEVKAQSVTADGYIYGKVTTFDNQYEGLIRWDDEEIFWFDHFNASKTKNEYYEKIRVENNPKILLIGMTSIGILAVYGKINTAIQSISLYASSET